MVNLMEVKKFKEIVKLRWILTTLANRNIVGTFLKVKRMTFNHIESQKK